jgi:hypothetical protein
MARGVCMCCNRFRQVENKKIIKNKSADDSDNRVAAAAAAVKGVIELSPATRGD